MTRSTASLDGIALGAQRALWVGFVVQGLIGYAVAWGYTDWSLWAWHRDRMLVDLGPPGVEAAPQTVALMRQLSAMLGATMASWAVAMVWVVGGPFLRRERWAWWCVLSSTLAWGLVDTAMSMRHGVWVNVVFNAMPLVMIGVPLAITWPSFFNMRPPAGLRG